MEEISNPWRSVRRLSLFVTMTVALAALFATGAAMSAGAATPCRPGQPCIAPLGGAAPSGPVVSGVPATCHSCRWPKGWSPVATRPGETCMPKKVFCQCGPDNVKSQQAVCLYILYPLPRTH